MVARCQENNDVQPRFPVRITTARLALYVTGSFSSTLITQKQSVSGNDLTCMLQRLNLVGNHLATARQRASLAKMSTFALQDTSIQVKLTEDLTKDELLRFPAFKVSDIMDKSLSSS